MYSTMWRFAFAAVLVSASLAFAEPPDDTERDQRERRERAEPGRLNDRRSGVPGDPYIDPGSGTQGTATSGGGEAGGGLTGSEGQHDRETGGTR